MTRSASGKRRSGRCRGRFLIVHLAWWNVPDCIPNYSYYQDTQGKRTPIYGLPKQIAPVFGGNFVGGTGLEPATSSV